MKQAGGGYESQLRVAESMMRQTQESVSTPPSFGTPALGVRPTVTCHSPSKYKSLRPALRRHQSDLCTHNAKPSI